METDPISTTPAPTTRGRTTRVDAVGMTPWGLSDRACLDLSTAILAIGFVLIGAAGLDVSPAEGRLALATGGSPAPMGQVYGYWAPDLWPAEVLPSLALSRQMPSWRPTSEAIRWPSAIAAVLGGWLLARGMHRALGFRAGIWTAACWLGSLAMIHRSAGAGFEAMVGSPTSAGLNLILGVATVASIERLLSRGADWSAGLWASVAFLAGGWPPLLLIALVILVIGRRGSSFSARLILPVVAVAIGWSIAAIRAATAQGWASALTLPLTRGLDPSLPIAVVLLAFPWSPFAAMILARSARVSWPGAGRAWVKAWAQATVVALVAGTLVPGLGAPARVVALAGLAVASAAGLDLAWKRSLPSWPRLWFQATLAGTMALWLFTMTFGSFLWIVTMPFYRPLGIAVAIMGLVVAGLGWSSLASANSRRGLVTLLIMAAGLKLAHWGYFAPEWNYRLSQGPWGRAIGQWVPRKWPIYTIHDWRQPDLMFYTGRAVRQIPGPRFLRYLPGDESRFLLLQDSEFRHWPEDAPPLSLVARFLDASGEKRVLARTPGQLPVPGQGARRQSASGPEE